MALGTKQVEACITCTSTNYELGRQKRRGGRGRVPRDGCTLWRAPSPTRSWDLRLRSSKRRKMAASRSEESPPRELCLQLSTLWPFPCLFPWRISQNPTDRGALHCNRGGKEKQVIMEPRDTSISCSWTDSSNALLICYCCPRTLSQEMAGPLVTCRSPWESLTTLVWRKGTD